MANIKYSQFTAEADINNFDDIVGYAGAVNTRITPANLASSLITLSGGPYLPIAAGVGNPLTGDLYIGNGTLPAVDVFINTAGAAGDETQIQSQGQQFMFHEKGTDMRIGPSDDIVIDDSGTAIVTVNSTLVVNSDIIDKNGSAGNADFMLVSDGGAGAGVDWKNPFENQYIGYKSFQTFVWTNGSPVAYTNWLSATASYLPFDATPLIETGTYTGAASNYSWTCTNAAGGTAGQVATFTLGANGAGTWKIRTCQHWFDQTSQVEMRVSLEGTATGGAKIDIIDQKSTELTGDKIFYGELVQVCGAGDTIQVECEFTVGGVNPFPSDSGNRPIEVTFEKIV